VTGCHTRSGDLTSIVFRAHYRDFDLHMIGRGYLVISKGTPWFAGHSLGDIARQISDHEYTGAGQPPPSPAGTAAPGQGAIP
jgi:hypothetical protein